MTPLNARLAGAKPLQVMKGPQMGGGLIDGICNSLGHAADMAVDAASPTRRHDSSVGSLIHQGPSGMA